MAKYTGPVFCVTFPLAATVNDIHVLEKRFKIANKMQNALIGKGIKRWNELQKSKEYKTIRDSFSSNKEKNAKLYQELKVLVSKYGLDKSGFEKLVKPMQHHFKENIDSHAAQDLAKRVSDAFEKVIFKNGKSIHKISLKDFTSISGKTNATGIRFLKDPEFDCYYLSWNGLEIPVSVANNEYEQTAVRNEISLTKIVRKFIRGRYKYYVQVTFRGVPPLKHNMDGSIKYALGEGDVGIDNGTSTMAVVSEKTANMHELADKVQSIESEIRKLLRKMDRSRRATNPSNFNENGTVKTKAERTKWVESKIYKRDRNKLKDLYRHQADVRKPQHIMLANEVLTLGSDFYVEDLNYAALAKRSKSNKQAKSSKDTSTDSTQHNKNKRANRFGKSIGHRAPAMFLSILEKKLEARGAKLTRIDTKACRASQYNHFVEEYKKKKLSQRWNDFNGIKVQRDLYSAFLIMNVNKDLKSFDKKKCDERFAAFKVAHDAEIERLRHKKNLSCIGVCSCY